MKSDIELAYHRMNSDGNLTRCYRTIFTMIGASTIHLIDSKCQLRDKHLHSAKGAHEIKRYDSEEEFWEACKGKEHIVIEVNGETPIQKIQEHIMKVVWQKSPPNIVLHFGGESVHLPVRKEPYSGLKRFKIETTNRLPFINDVVTGIVLHEITR